MNLKIIILSARNQTEKEYIVYKSTYINPRIGKLIYSDREQISCWLEMDAEGHKG